MEAVCHREMSTLGYPLEYEPGDADSLLAELPDESRFQVPRSEAELARYTPFFEVTRRLRARWAERRVDVTS